MQTRKPKPQSVRLRIGAQLQSTRRLCEENRALRLRHRSVQQRLAEDAAFEVGEALSVARSSVAFFSSVFFSGLVSGSFSRETMCITVASAFEIFSAAQNYEALQSLSWSLTE